MKINPLTSSEEQIMTIMWKLGNAYMKDIMEQFPEPKPHQNTVSTFMKILLEKEYLTAEKQGRIFLYKVAVPYEDYRQQQLKIFIENYYENNPSLLYRHLLDTEFLSLSDINDSNLQEGKPNPLKPEGTQDAITELVAELTSGKKPKKKDKKKRDKKKK